MSHVIESPSPTQCKILFTIDSSEVNKVINSNIQAYAKDLDLPGFRKGKVPTTVIEKRFSEDVYNRATENLINTSINNALEENKLHPLNRVQLENDDSLQKIARDTAFAFTCYFEVLPPIDIPNDFSELSVNVEKPEIDPKLLEEFSRHIRQNLATMEDVTEERLPQNGDILLVDVEGFLDGTEIPGLGAKNFHIQLRSENEDKDVEKLVRSLRIGEENKGSMVCPDDYPDATVRGKDIEIQVKLHKILKEILPELDDAFAKTAGFADVDALKTAIHSQAVNNKMAEIKGKSQQELLNSMLDKIDFPLPESMVQKAISNYMMDARNSLAKQGVDSDTMVEALAGMKEEGEVGAKKMVKEQAFLLAVATRENIQTSEQEIDMYIRQMANETKQDFDKLRDHVWKHGIVHDIRERIVGAKSLDFIYNKAKRIIVDAKGNVLRNEEDSKPAEV